MIGGGSGRFFTSFVLMGTDLSILLRLPIVASSTLPINIWEEDLFS